MNLGREKTQSSIHSAGFEIGGKMRVAVLSSGGKDSAYATWWAGLQGWEIVSIATVMVKGEDSMMFQLGNTWVAGLQACSMGIPWLPVISHGIEEEEVSDLERVLSGDSDTSKAFEEIWPSWVEVPQDMVLQKERPEIDGLVVGALRSDYQKTRIERMCERLGIRSFCPLWHKNGKSHMQSLVEHGFDVVFTSVSTEGLGQEWLGKKLDLESLLDLRTLSRRHRFNMDGEGGEFETFVVNSPDMTCEIEYTGKPHWQGSRGIFKMDSCALRYHR
tara:strand:- start:5689 stop:6510 length:822 start_codon:yes stop_codon:yes gene_type:complete